MPKLSKSKERSIRGLSPDSPAKTSKAVRLKKLPRGKAFPKGNLIGLRTRFAPGNKANLSGRPASKGVSSALRILASLEIGQPVEIRTNAEQTAAQLWRMGQSGSLAAIREILDRCEGKPATTLNVNDGREDPFKILVESMTQRSAIVGPPDDSGEDSQDDDYSPRSLGEGEGDSQEETPDVV
jgi:hypothetical protein